MKLSTKGRYGTRALLDVALHQDNSPVQLKVIAQRQQISLHYLEHIIAPLLAAGLLRSTRGAYGGISLGKPPQEIVLSEVIQVLEGSITPVECVDDPNVCSRAHICVTRDVWTDVKKAMAGVLESITLQDLVERQKDKQKLESTMYYI
ncbi:MAG: Rrf2 family transcriptional regulator [Dehalococcoidia bacterium]|nr:Rrf2 family transcriptional regulator [Dehalococcoidia bacterium]